MPFYVHHNPNYNSHHNSQDSKGEYMDKLWYVNEDTIKLSDEE